MNLPDWGTVDLMDYTISFCGRASFLYLFEEIFAKASYLFHSDTDRPLDCGSNIGMSVLFFKKLYPAARITAFEPDPRTYARADQGLVADDLEGQADQDRREGGEPRPLCYLPDGRGHHRTANVPRDFAAHRGATAASTTSASMRRSTVMRSRATDGMSASECLGKRPDQAVKHRSDGRECREPSTLSRLGLPASSENAYHPRQFRVHLGNPGQLRGGLDLGLLPPRRR
jgi:hypothetical protein